MRGLCRALVVCLSVHYFPMVDSHGNTTKYIYKGWYTMNSERGQGLVVFVIVVALVVGAVYILSGDMSLSNIFLDVFSYHG